MWLRTNSGAFKLSKTFRIIITHDEEHSYWTVWAYNAPANHRTAIIHHEEYADAYASLTQIAEALAHRKTNLLVLEGDQP